MADGYCQAAYAQFGGFAVLPARFGDLSES
jgi:hypothetical protein